MSERKRVVTVVQIMVHDSKSQFFKTKRKFSKRSLRSISE